jgi:hypothetical protein
VLAPAFGLMLLTLHASSSSTAASARACRSAVTSSSWLVIACMPMASFAVGQIALVARNAADELRDHLRASCLQALPRLPAPHAPQILSPGLSCAAVAAVSWVPLLRLVGGSSNKAKMTALLPPSAPLSRVSSVAFGHPRPVAPRQARTSPWQTPPPRQGCTLRAALPAVAPAWTRPRRRLPFRVPSLPGLTAPRRRPGLGTHLRERRPDAGLPATPECC